MINKYNNPRLFNTVLTGPGMTHPRNPHVVIGSDTKGFVQGDLMDANAIMETIDQKIDVDNLIDEEKLTTTVQTAVDSILGDVSESLDTLKEVEDKFEEVEDKIKVISTTSTTLIAEVSRYYDFSETINTLSVTLPTPSDTTSLSSVLLRFTTGTTPNVTITSASDVYWYDGYEIEAESTYEVNCLFNGSNWTIAAAKIGGEA